MIYLYTYKYSDISSFNVFLNIETVTFYQYFQSGHVYIADIDGREYRNYQYFSRGYNGMRKFLLRDKTTTTNDEIVEIMWSKYALNFMISRLLYEL